MGQGLFPWLLVGPTGAMAAGLHQIWDPLPEPLGVCKYNAFWLVFGSLADIGYVKSWPFWLLFGSLADIGYVKSWPFGLFSGSLADIGYVKSWPFLAVFWQLGRYWVCKIMAFCGCCLVAWPILGM